MGGNKDYRALFGRGTRDNVSFTLNSGETMTLNFKEAGTNSLTNLYFDLKAEANRVHIVVNKIATITHIGNQELQSPKTLGTANANVFFEGIEWDKITVRADQDATSFEVYAS